MSEIYRYAQIRLAGTEVPPSIGTNVGTAASSIFSSLLTLKAGETLDSLKVSLFDYMGKNNILASILKGADIVDVPDILESSLNWDWEYIIDAIKAGIGQGVGGIHGSLYETISGANALLQVYNGQVMQVGIAPWVQRWVNDTYRPAIPTAETAWYMWRLGQLSADDYHKYTAYEGWDDSFRVALEQSWHSPPPIQFALDMRRRGYISETTFKQLMAYYRLHNEVIDSIHGLVEQYPEPYRLADMYVKGHLEQADYVYAMGIHGLGFEWAETWAGMQLQYPDISSCITMLRREIITSEEFMTYMHRNGFGGAQIKQMEQLREVIPPLPDLIHMAVREAFPVPAGEPQFNEMKKYAKLQGLSDWWVDRYWWSHFNRMGLGQAYENLWRGNFSKEAFEYYLLISDVHPDDWDAIYNVAFRPPSIRELGYGYDVGAYTREDIKRYRRWGGLSEVDAEKATDALVAYRTEAEREAIRREYMYLFANDQLTEAELRAGLGWVKTNPEALELWVARAKLYAVRIKKPEMDVEGRITSSTEALRAFRLGLRDEEWTRNALKELYWTQDRIEVAVEYTKLQIAEDKEKIEEVKEKQLTVTQYRALYTAGKIDKEGFVNGLIALNYPEERAKLLVDLYSITAPTEVAIKPFTTAVAEGMYRLAMFDEEELHDNYILQDWDVGQAWMLTIYSILKQEFPYLRALYEKGVLSSTQLTEKLMDIGMPKEDATALTQKTIDELQIERLTVEKDLTKSEIIKGVKNNILTASQGVNLLMDIGYDEAEGWYILAINKVVEAGDPEGYWEMKKVTESWKKARGEKYMEIPDEAIMLERSIKNTKAKIAELKGKPEEEATIGKLAVELADLEARLKTLIIKAKLQ